MTVANALAAALKKEKIGSDAALDMSLWLSTGVPNLDYALSGKYRGGGLQSGRIHEIAGPPSAGKTQIATECMVSAQQAGGAANFRDHENAYLETLAVSIGLDISPGIYTYNRPETFEESLDGAIDWMETIRNAKVIPFEAPLVTVFDSFASMVPAEKMIRDPKKAEAAHGKAANMREKVGLATASSQELPAFNQFVSRNNAIAIFLNQLGTKPGVAYGDPRYTKGGESLPYYSSTRTWLNRAIIRDAKTKRVLGQKITAEVIKNKTHRAYEKTSWFFMFREDGTGYIDKVASMIDHLNELNLMKKDGDAFVWDGKNRTRPALVKLLNEDPDGLDKLIKIGEA